MKYAQGFLIEGYQAGVLGGVQETKPFLDAIGVSMRQIFLADADEILIAYSIRGVRRPYR